MKQIRIVIVDDHELVREGLSSMLANGQITVVGSFGDPKEVLSRHHSLAVDVFLLDIKMPVMNGFDLAISLKSQNPTYKVILLSMEVNHTYIKRAITEKVDGYIPKNSNIDVVKEGITEVMKGNKYYDNDIKEYIFQLMMNESDINMDPSLGKLSNRETHVLRLLVDGKQNKEIGELLFISTKTVETHRNNIMKKLDITTTADLVKFAIAKGLTTNPYE